LTHLLNNLVYSDVTCAANDLLDHSIDGSSLVFAVPWNCV
jgi:hypothetical protein